MTQYPPSTIAQLLFESTPSKTFPALVRDLDQALARLGGERRVTWDHDDIVFVDLNGTRVGLGFVEDPTPELAACLTVSVGPAPGETSGFRNAAHENLCHRIADRANDTLHASEILWHESDQPVTADLVDALVDLLEAPEPVAAPVVHAPPPEPVTEDLVDRLLDSHPFPDKLSRQNADPAPRRAEAEPEDDSISLTAPIKATVTPITEAIRARAAARAAEKARAKVEASRTVVPPKRRRANAELDRVRTALYAQMEEPQATNAQRLTAHAMNATLTIVMPPVGASLVAASYRYGTDLRLSARAMAATGALFGLAHTAAATELMGFFIM